MTEPLRSPHDPVIQSQQDSAASHYALIVLLLAYILSFIDRNILSLLVGPIRQEFNISDFQFSLLHGLAFTLFYIFLGLPVGWLADRHSRKRIIFLGVAFWSLMTCLCGYARNFATLFLARIGVGVGEATLSPAAYSLLSDLYSPKNLRWATAIFAMGITLGSGVSYLIGGWLFDAFSAADLESIPILGRFSAWQLTFITVGLPGFLMVLLIAFIREPARTNLVSTVPEQAPPVREVALFLKQHARAYTGIILGISMMAIVGYGTLIWYPEFLVRTYDMSKSAAGAALGSIFIFAGTGGTFAGAWFSSLLQKAGYSDANLRLVMLAALVACGPATIAPLLASSTWALILTAFVIFVHYTHFGVAMAGLQNITPNRMRAQISALLLFMANLFGLALGGTIVASLTDFVFRSDLLLNYSLATISMVFYPLAAFCVWSGLAKFRQMLP